LAFGGAGAAYGGRGGNGYASNAAASTYKKWVLFLINSALGPTYGLGGHGGGAIELVAANDLVSVVFSLNIGGWRWWWRYWWCRLLSTGNSLLIS
jgi:hypothetical protein